MKCAIYLRTLNEKLANLQKEEMLKYANEKNWTVEVVYKDLSGENKLKISDK